MTTTPTEHRAKIAEARNVLGEVIARARFAGEPTILVNRGKEAAVIVGYDFYENAKADAAVLRELRAHVAELEAGSKPDEKSKARVLGEELAAAERRAESD
ncbi:type II toxin-antitoxin system prevent-host-death family antitoxin [Streptomyces sp. SID8374]|uniref:type II toxin-antitoxin system prevent-host-death family antitoxin n=1 Tax=Streptomyces sp. SID8374 TaxID=2690354 RepID=UPI00136C002C|nr:type II toxin-antitoxin system prevent-host-death family antitoxin [Streptomyces sp. SID8374]MYX14447.1 type II toxin-antitoxin system prevent-host-death family antitoxin [Streptomyces sp. SID8374]